MLHFECWIMSPDDITRNLLFAKQACLWEARARKPGNVHPKASFADMNYADFVRSADCFPECGLGDDLDYYRYVDWTKSHVGKNTNLGMIILLVPMLHIPPGCKLRSELPPLLMRQG